MRAILNGVLAYGLMNVPVGVCTAQKRKDFEFRTLHKTCLLPISTEKQCPVCQAGNLQGDDLVKGYEFSKGNFIVLEEGELTQLASERSKVIAIKKFVPWDGVDELQVEKSYYLQPNSVLARPYTLLSNAMGTKEVVGVGSCSLWGKEYPSMVWARESGVLVLSMLYCHDEVVDDTPVTELMGLVPTDEQDLANEFVSVMLSDLDPKEDFVSPSRRRLDEYIGAKIQGIDFEVAEPEVSPEPTTNITDTLRASIELARSR